MTQLTNKHNLPAPLAAALAHDEYDNEGADLSITRLWSPFRQTLLERQPHDPPDVSDLVYALLGKAVHKYIHEITVARPELGHLPEKRLHAEVNGVKLSGAFDSLCLHSGVLQDYKVTSVWSVVKDSRHDDWELQMNSYAWLLRRHGFAPAALEVVAICKDWSKSEAKRNGEYPRSAVSIIPIKLLPHDVIDSLIQQRVALWLVAQKELPLCTPEETWERGGSFAVMKQGRERAIKLAATMDEAQLWMDQNRKAGEKLTIERRPAQRIRCESYCDVASICTQYAAWKESQ